MRNDYYDIDLDDYDRNGLNIYFLLYNLTKAGVIGHIRYSCSGKNFHAIRLKEYPFPLHDEQYDSLTLWKEVSTVTSEEWEYVWVGKEVLRKIGEASNWFILDETALFHIMNEVRS